MSEETLTEEVDGSTEEVEEVTESENSGSEATEEDSGSEYSKKVQERITHLTSEKKSFEHEKEVEMRKRMAIEQENKRLKEQLKTTAEVAGSRPTVPLAADFENEFGDTDIAAYREAMVKHEDALLNWHDSKRQLTSSEDQAEIDARLKNEKYEAKAIAAKAKYPDYEEVTSQKIFSVELNDALLEDANTEVIYYLGKNPNEAIKLNQMSPNKMMKELGKIEEKISRMTPETSTAPAPINPVSEDGGDVEIDDGKLSDEQWFARERKRDLEKFKRES